MEQHRELLRGYLTATLPKFGEFLILVVKIMSTQLGLDIGKGSSPRG